MTTSTAPTTRTEPDAVRLPPQETSPLRVPRPAARVPLSRLAVVELRKMFDTRSGLWLLAGLGIAAVLTSGAILAWAPSEQLTYGEFTMAIGVPMTVILPILAVLSVTSEWGQRTGLATFTLVPHRGRVLLAKALAAVAVTVPATAVAFSVGALGNVVGAAAGDVPAVWDQGWSDVASFALGQTLLLLVGFTLGALVRNSPAAIVTYMVYGFVVPGLLTLLALSQEWFGDARPWVDPKYNQDALLRGGLAADQWPQLAVTTVVWLAVPMAVAVVNVLRSEVK